jgi:hypothetical protein
MLGGLVGGRSNPQLNPKDLSPGTRELEGGRAGLGWTPWVPAPHALP